MKMRSVATWVRSIVIGLGALTLTAPAMAAQGDDCPTWFPDFRCDRKARPDGSVMPMSFPYLFEDPYITSGVNFVGIWHDFPDDSIFLGGQAGVVALQLRVAITEKLALIATKDGIAVFDPNGAPAFGGQIVPDDFGLMNLGVGLKYAAFQWTGSEGQSAIISPHVRYEAPSGERAAYQGHDKGIVIPGVSMAYNHANWHLIASLGGQLPIDTNRGSDQIFYNFHVSHSFPVDLGFLRFLTPFIELNGLHYTDSGDGRRLVNTEIAGRIPLVAAIPITGPFEGADILNLGSPGVMSDNLITMAWGLRLPAKWGLQFGVSYERPLSNRKDIFEQRVTTNVTWEF